MRRLAWLVVCLLALLTLASMCGSSPRRGYSPVYGDRYAKGKGYAPGQGGSATLDTVTVIFTTQDVLTDDNNPASIDTSLVINTFVSRTAADSDRRLAFQLALASADSVHRLGASYKVANFAYGYIDTADTSGYRHSAGYYGSFKSSRNVSSAPTKLNRNFPTGDRRAELVYIPFEKYIRPGATIVDAYINRAAIPTANATTTADTFFVSQISRASDNKWYTTKGSQTGLTDYARASWTRQVSSNAGSLGWGSTNAFPWSPPLAARLKFRSWGAVMDSSATPANLVINQGFNTSIVAPVQSVVSGAVNNGMIINYALNKSYADQLHCYLWNDQSNASGRTPYVVVRYTRGIYYGQSDNTAPAPPTSLLAYGLDGTSVLTWTHSVSVDRAIVNVYRYFDGAAAVKIGESGSGSYFDASAVNGSAHNYYVTAVDRSGNESTPSESVRVTPGTIEAIDRPAYAALWYQNISAATALTSAQLDSLAAFDALVTWSYPFSTGAQNEASMDSLLSNLRARNPNIALLTYINVITPDVSWEDYPAGSPQKKHWDYCVAADGDSAGFGRNLAGGVVESDRYPTLFSNVMYPDLADTLAKFWVEAFDATDSDGELAGFFVDVSDSTLAAHLCYANGCRTKMDFDQDGTAYTSDAGEKAAFQQFHIDFFKALRREFAERNMPSRLLVANTTFGRKLPAAQTANDSLFLSLLDGVLVEGFNKYWPANAAAPSVWEIAEAQQDLLINAQTAPPLMLWHAIADSSALYMSEVPAIAFDGFAMAVNGKDANGTNSIPRLPRRLPVPGTWNDPTFEDGGSDPDTMTSAWRNYTARMMLQRNASAPSDTYAVWPYVIFNAAGDTLSQSLYWESAGEIGAPIAPVGSTLGGDRSIFMYFETCGGCGSDHNQSDVTHVRLERKQGVSIVTFDLALDTLSTYENYYMFTNTGLTNGLTYSYKIYSVDALGNVSSGFGMTARTPVDNDAPPAPTDMVALGSTGKIELDFNAESVYDLVGWEIWRAPDDNGSPGVFALMDTVSVSAHSDSTAVSGQTYYFYAVAVDDDENSSAPSDTVSGAWYGTVDPTYPPPSNVRALADNPSGYTSVVIYPPSDQTGLTSYSVYRGRYAGGAAATDTTACTLYKTGLTPDGFGGHVFVDLHATNGAAEDTAFQYTARALYSGNASEKYAVPAWALSTGGFSAQTPGCFAFGNGTNISVACMTLAGSDSTRIFRGTSAGTQSYVTTVAVANNPWTDTTALANTDYWYKLRQVDDGVVSQFSAVSGPARWTSSTGPAVTDSGDAGTTLQHGESITITGPNLGTKRPNGVGVGPPIMYDSFDNGVNGQRLTTTPRWRSYQNWDSPYGAIFADQTWYPQAVPYGNRGKCLYGAMVNGVPTDAMAYNLDFAATDTLYYSYNYRLNFWDSRLATPAYNMATSFGVIKLGRSNRVGEDYAGRGEMSFSDNDIIWNDGAGGDHSNNAAVAESHKYYAIANPSSWKRMEMFRAIPNLPATTDQYGPIWWRRNGQFIPIQSSYHPEWPNSNLGNQMLRAAGQTWRIGTILLPFGWANMWQGCSTCRGEMYCDDVYVDNTQMRVEIGNNSTFNSCTERNIQIPATWTPTSITATVNTGAFADGSYYLFVLGEDGQPVATVPIVIDNP